MRNALPYSKLDKNSDGTVLAYAWPGGYPLIYFDPATGDVLHPACVDAEASDGFGDTVSYLRDVFWEGEEWCAACNQPIESAYGPVED